MIEKKIPKWLQPGLARYHSPKLPNGFYWVRVGDLLIVTRISDPGQVYAACRREQGLKTLFRRFNKMWVDLAREVNRGK